MATAHDHYMALSARRHMWRTIPQLACDLAAVFGIRISGQSADVLQRLAFTPGVKSVTSRNVPNKVILVESLFEDKVELAFIPSTHAHLVPRLNVIM
ncbi:hypothetical protein TNCV_3412351 [Trichonephila clavipes]|uniref:Uncharacterized protein n=1 Tax=Trichonephila clavipes TaxID=2585209 RepID=A0A8X6V3M6_TRICX|nr:hypothetical protein TNCV_3412351 [Trichonephila clavipes]